jgi:hypothetical protein
MAGSGRKNADSALSLALATGATVGVAARRAGVSERTAYRRLQDPAFRSLVDRTRSQIVDRTVAGLATLGRSAVATLAKLLRDPSPRVRLRACRTVLEFLFRGNEQYTLARQVEELRRLVEDSGQGQQSDQP